MRTILTILLTLHSCLVFAKDGSHKPDQIFRDFLQTRGLTEDYETGHELLLGSVFLSLAQDKNDDDEVDMAKKAYFYWKQDFDKAKNEHEILKAYQKGLRLLYATYFNGKYNLYYTFESVMELLFRPQFSFYYVTPQLVPVVSLNLEDAKKEARNLYNRTEDRYFLPKSLVGKTIQEISELDIDEDDAILYSDKTIKDNPEIISENYRSQMLEKQITKKLRKDNILTEEQKYSFDKATKFLVFDGFKTNDSSPKFNTKDLYGQKWKVKFGSEDFVEVITNSLYRLIGGKTYDHIVVTQSQKNPVLVILGKVDEEDCSESATIEHFSYCMKKGRFKFFLPPFIAQSGLLDEKLLNNFTDQISILDKSKYLGRNFVIFKVASLEFKPKSGTQANIGPMTFSEIGSEDDRSARALGIFNAFISNKDARMKNNRLTLEKSEDGDLYFESMQDLGASLGVFLADGAINAVDSDFGFIREKLTIAQPFSYNTHRVNFPGLFIYRPEAFRRATHADTLWMVRRLVRITREDLTSTLKRTHLPDFMQQAWIENLLKRRDNLADFYGITLNKSERAKTLNIVLDVSTAEKRQVIAAKYQIPFDIYNKYLKNKKTETIIKDGVVFGCHRSALVSLLESENYPSGLERRITRITDNKALPKCHP